MKKNKINLFQVSISNKQNSFIFSLPHSNDDLTYDYFVLSEGDEIIVEKITNVLNFLQDGHITLVPIEFGTDEFLKFQELYEKYCDKHNKANKLKVNIKNGKDNPHFN